MFSKLLALFTFFELAYSQEPHILCECGNQFTSSKVDNIDVNGLNFLSKVTGGVAFEVTGCQPDDGPIYSGYTLTQTIGQNQMRMIAASAQTMVFAPPNGEVISRAFNYHYGSSPVLGKDGTGFSALFPDPDFMRDGKAFDTNDGAWFTNRVKFTDCVGSLPLILIRDPEMDRRLYTREWNGIIYTSSTGTFCRADVNSWTVLKRRLAERSSNTYLRNGVQYSITGPTVVPFTTPVFQTVSPRWDTDLSLSPLQVTTPLDILRSVSNPDGLIYSLREHFVPGLYVFRNLLQIRIFQSDKEYLLNYLGKCLGIPGETGCENDIAPSLNRINTTWSDIRDCYNDPGCDHPLSRQPSSIEEINSINEDLMNLSGAVEAIKQSLSELAVKGEEERNDLQYLIHNETSNLSEEIKREIDEMKRVLSNRTTQISESIEVLDEEMNNRLEAQMNVTLTLIEGLSVRMAELENLKTPGGKRKCRC